MNTIIKQNKMQPPVVEKEKTMRIGLAQMNIIWEDIRENEEKIRNFFQSAKENQVKLLVFPEMSLTGFSMNVEKTAGSWEEQVDYFRRMTLEYEIAAVFGYPKPVSDEERELHPNWKGYYNKLAFMENGEIKLDYTKIHPFTYGQEGDYFQGGGRITLTSWKDTVLGAFICYDLRFPEIFQISSEKSEIIFVIANWPVKRIAHWDCLLRARAIENQCYIVGVNRTGEGGGLLYNGHSAIYSPLGELLTTICEEEALLIGDIDPEEVRSARAHFPVKADRKEEIYKKNNQIFV